jgi:hypothetical protein
MARAASIVAPEVALAAAARKGAVENWTAGGRLS